MSRQSIRTNEPQEYPTELLKKVMKKTTFIGALSMIVPNKRLVKTIKEAFFKRLRFERKKFDNLQSHLKFVTDYSIANQDCAYDREK